MFRAPFSFRAAQLRALTDEALMERIDDADAQAFEVIFDRHGGAAFSLAYRMCGRRSAAEDIVQETFLSLWRRGGRYERARGSVRSWVLGAVQNKAIDSFRHQAATAGRDVSDDQALEELAAPNLTDGEADRRAEASQIRAALGHLPTDQRRVIELAYFGGFTHVEIADMLELPAGTVKGRMRLGLIKLRLSLGDLRSAAGGVR
ncbi:MAG TPA: sigma-70 family RNA polymerase sigma factor [Solirubrobacteraceae bacterium]|nr:sigma-70 family RNA polymerase sigma factor [Solirubrobacteraceae bacterium]